MEPQPRDATPHHLIFLADPQLIDPHSYPGRPWPLSTFTFWHTDNYLKRNYIQLQKQLHPDTVFFLGDLFDGGREWKTAHGNTVDPAWANGQRPSGEAAYLKTWGKRYGEDFWLHEYDRFGRIFYKFWDLAGAEPGVGQRGRKIISSLPGNHDLGFGDKIKIPIRNRFETYFGQGNRVDVIANHTFVSVDSVSLSAGGLPHATEELVRPVENFLQEVQALKRKAVARELRFQNQVDSDFRYNHIVEEAATANYKKIPTMDPGKGAAEFPTILLTHVPLYRKPGTPCGPKREHWPPATPPKGQFTPVFPDHRNAISISGGYQYQNVLTEDHSVKLVSAVGNVGLVFSGDDHDYCEIVHPENKNNAREITVKSISWAMGVRRPGFVMLSMWNPVGPNGELLHSAPTGHGAGSQTAMTVETHLCLQPDQLGIFMRYGFLVVITILTISIRAILTPILNLTPFSNPYTASEPTPLLPTSAKDFKRHSSLSQDSHSSNSSTSSTTSAPGLAPRTTASRTRSVSPVNGYAYSPQAQPPLISHAHNAWSDKKEEDKYSFRSFGEEAEKKRRPLTGGALVWKEMWTSLWRVGWVALTVYLYLVCFG
ncbi:hypothetical protein B0O99DRAFT_102758 [Bisporella sp. PMI_857]|nr:hypothetical protein B0O99DRAFT_102758 [Bisporella sp. PMI_857]